MIVNSVAMIIKHFVRIRTAAMHIRVISFIIVSGTTSWKEYRLKRRLCKMGRIYAHRVSGSFSFRDEKLSKYVDQVCAEGTTVTSIPK